MEWLIAGTLIGIGALGSYAATKLFSKSASTEEVHTIIQNHVEAQAQRDYVHESFQNTIISAIILSLILVILGVVFRFVYIGIRATLANREQERNVRPARVLDP